MNKFSTLLLTIILTTASFSAFAQTERDRAIQLYKAGNYKDSISLLEKITKQDGRDAAAMYYLGSAYFKVKKMNEGGKAFKKLIELKPENAEGYVGYAYYLLDRNQQSEAGVNARKAIELDAKNAEAHYISGVVSFRNQSYNAAYTSAEKAIELNPKLPFPYLLKSESLVRSYAQTMGAVTKSPTERTEMLKESAALFEKYLELEPEKNVSEKLQPRLSSLQFFADYYGKRNANPDTVYSKPIKLLSQPKPPYTDDARRNGVTGTITILVEFKGNGKIGHLMVTRGLSHGLSENALEAAQGIKFSPAERDGKPVTVVRPVQYSFAM